MQDIEKKKYDQIASYLRHDNVPIGFLYGMIMAIFEENMTSVSQSLYGLAKHVISKAYELAPYRRDISNLALTILSKSGDSTARITGEQAYLARHPEPQNELGKATDLIQQRFYTMASKICGDVLRNDPMNTEALLLLIQCFVALGNHEMCERTFSHFAPYYTREHPFERYFTGKWAEYLFHCGDLEQARRKFELILAHQPLPLWLNHLGEILYRMGRREDALRTWEQSLKIDPAQTTLYLRIHDKWSGLDSIRETSLAGVPITILLYSWNNHIMLKNTLESLASTEIGDAKILVLDNHSTDETPQMLQALPRMFPRNQTRVITLPTNIGAPAARSWLMKQPEVTGSEYTAYLDDDVLLPPDWLPRMIATLKRFPSASQVGARVIDPEVPVRLQYTYRFIINIGPNSIPLSPQFCDTPDLGQMDMIRKVNFVMGCCHVFRTRKLLETGEFDIRFSPTQVDDLEHCLRGSLQGHEIIYCGHVPVIHCQKSGKDSTMNNAARGNVIGNSFKLVKKYDARELGDLFFKTNTIDRDYIRECIGNLHRMNLLRTTPEVPFGIA